ncbi:PepSY domain-containing protein [Massilia sp. UMI-21]|nr:PepSY domain-containing protein [Massilia sp. UMI-21]
MRPGSTGRPPPAPSGAAPATSTLYRRVWRWHFYAGLLCLPFIFLLALTGAVYLFNKQIDDVVHADLLLRPPPSAAVTAALPAGRLLDRALRAEPGVARALYWPADARHTVQVDVQTRDGAVRQVFLDPASGAVLGSLVEAECLMPLVKRIHSLTVAGKVGNALVEIVAGWVIVLVLSGTWLWWPRGRSSGVLRIRPQASGRLWWRDLHAVTGALAAVVILFLALTGMPWSLVWGSQVNSWLTANGLGTPVGVWFGAPRSTVPMGTLGEVPWSLERQAMPASTPPADIHRGHAAHDMPAHAGPPRPGTIGIDRAAAAFAAAGLRDAYRLVLPGGPEGVYSAIRLRSADAGLRVIHLDQYSGKLLQDIGPRDVGAVARITDWGIGVHQGLEYGLPNQLLMLAGCLALMLLCVSSVAMWWKRRPAGRLGAPARKDGDRLALGVIAIAACLGLVFPLLGASMLAAALFDAAWSRWRAPPALPHAS